MHAPRNHALPNDCPKGHEADEANRDIETRKKIEESALISEILDYDSSTDLCGEEGGGGMRRPKDEMEAMIAGEAAAPPTTDALALVLEKMAEMQAQTSREQREANERADQRHREMMERAEQRAEQRAEKLAEKQLQQAIKAGELTIEVVGQMSQDLTAAIKNLNAPVPALSRTDRLLDEVIGVAHAALRVYVEKNLKD
jgi:hypothetical protein